MKALDQENLQKLLNLNNSHVTQVVQEFIARCKPKKVSVITDSKKDIEYCRQKAIEVGEESKLEIQIHVF
jgi:GTP-dependent phosphoenolpyruvate carboxykinase